MPSAAVTGWWPCLHCHVRCLTPTVPSLVTRCLCPRRRAPRQRGSSFVPVERGSLPAPGRLLRRAQPSGLGSSPRKSILRTVLWEDEAPLRDESHCLSSPSQGSNSQGLRGLWAVYTRADGPAVHGRSPAGARKSLFTRRSKMNAVKYDASEITAGMRIFLESVINAYC